MVVEQFVLQLLPQLTQLQWQLTRFAAHFRCTQSSKSAPMGDQTLQPHLETPRWQLYTNSHYNWFQTIGFNSGFATTVAGPKFTII